MLSHKAAKHGRLCLCDDATGSIMEKSINHHAVVTQHCSYKAHARCCSFVYRFLATNAMNDAACEIKRLTGTLPTIRAGLYFDECSSLVCMDHSVKEQDLPGKRRPSTTDDKPGSLAFAAALRKSWAFFSPTIKEMAMPGIKSLYSPLCMEYWQKQKEILARLIHNQHCAVRLDRTWNVDWFAVTISEIDRFGHIHCGRTFPGVVTLSFSGRKDQGLVDIHAKQAAIFHASKASRRW